MKQVSDKVKEITVIGKLIATFLNGQPVNVILEDTIFICIFSTKEKLETSMKEMNIDQYKIKEITDGPDFLDSVKEYRVMLDPWITERMTTRFTEIKHYEKEEK